MLCPYNAVKYFMPGIAFDRIRTGRNIPEPITDALDWECEVSTKPFRKCDCSIGNSTAKQTASFPNFIMQIQVDEFFGVMANKCLVMHLGNHTGNSFFITLEATRD